ncbi:hypothetical protein I314_04006 [Cryptococcus bacillisporus CA1873]|uniref:Uncharacterized protein n=1 Tax=Cryptococcus bacillisporus CA1873 TaxID=1296111 RepID=A0ABR5B9F6_CRYGA|nr:hypothetical protein I314_04006 [Cryptococcus bacillisporus CA1873]|eukprot:KIR60153.1 hypothetical protein I314_04006 [Cryptococcus gattii CA1873]
MSILSDMPPRSALSAPRQSHRSHVPLSQPKAPATQPSSRPATPSRPRGDIPRKFSQPLSSSRPYSPTRDISDNPPMTPSPRPQRKRRGGNKPSTQRAQASAPAVMAVDGEVVDRESGNSGEDYAQEDEDALFDLLGVVSPPKSVELHAQLESRPGLIVLPKGEGPNAVKKSRKARKSKKTAGQGSDLFVKDDDGLQQHGGVPVDPAPKEKSKKLTKLPLTATASAPPGPVQTTGPTPTLDQLLASAIPAAPSPKPRAKRVQRAQDDSTFEMSSLSQNLPSDLEGAGNGQQKKGKSKKKENASAVWDMPDAAGGDELTWQQKLAQTETPTRASRKPFQSERSERKGKSKLSTLYDPNRAANNCSSVAQDRQLSYDSIPTQLAQPILTAQQRLPVSAFDGHIPFHTGFNVHRAPQTPAKSVASVHGNLLMGEGALPVIPGEFPRIKGAGGVPVGGPKYAGPTFHNSPHAATLSKPDLEDF